MELLRYMWLFIKEMWYEISVGAVFLFLVVVTPILGNRGGVSWVSALVNVSAWLVRVIVVALFLLVVLDKLREINQRVKEKHRQEEGF